MESCGKSLSEEVQKKDVTLEPIAKTIDESNETLTDANASQTSKYASMNKKELVDALTNLLEQPKNDIKDDVASIKYFFYNIRKRELEEEKQSFINKGNEESAFAPLPDEEENELKEQLQKYKDLRAAQQAAIEAQLLANLERRRSIITELKSIAEDPDNINKQYQRFQQLQQEFKEVGDVPAADDKQLWRDYQTVAENFYDLWKINKELRDYDFKKNLEAKEALCAEAESLAEEKDVISAFNKLQVLHDKWREIGPVVKDLRESLWARFKDASTVVNKRHQAFFEEKKAKEKENETAKVGICQEAEAIDLSALTSFQKWDEATKQILALQERWKTLGYASRKVNNELFARFRKTCDEFFAQKTAFYKKKKEESAANLAKKYALCEKAEQMKDSTDWSKTAAAFVELQQEWKKIGPTHKKSADAVWKRFIEACDYFFDNKNKNRQEERTNLDKKRAIIERIKAIDESLPSGDRRKLLQELSEEFKNAGLVPFKDKDKVFDEYKKALDAAYDKLPKSQAKSRRPKTIDMAKLSEITDKDILLKEREQLVRMYEQKKNELKTFENNLGFFNVTSKTGNSMVKKVEESIANSKEKLESLARQISLIDEKL